MNNIKEKIKNIYIPFNHGSFALFISILALSFVIASSNSPCLQAQSTCAIGSDNTFSGNISLKGGTANSGTLDASGMTSDRTYTLPDASGTLALEGASLSASKVMATDVSGNETTTDVYPLSLTINSALKTDGSGNVTASNLDPETDLTIGTGTANQVLSVNSGGTALTFTSITGVPTLTGNQAVVTDGAGALTVANLTADKFVISDSNGSLTTTDIIPLSFGTNKPIVSDAAGNLTDVTLTADTPMKTDANGNTSASDLVPEDDLTVGSGTPGQMLAVNSGGTALEFVDAEGGGQWTLVASGNSKGATGSTSGGTASNDILFCWGGANSTDGVDGSYFRMTNNKRYKIVFAPRNTGSGSSASTGYSGNAIQWLGNNVDCSSGAVNTSNTGATSVYEYSVPSWWYYWNKNPTYNGYSYSNGDSDCKVLDNQTIQTNYMPVSWQGEIIYTEMHNYWNGGVYGVKGNWNINFNIMNSQSPYNSEPNAYSQGICMNTTGTTQGGYVDSLDDMYGLLLKDYRPYTWGGQDTWVKYWLYEDNYYSSN